jgi:SAM-dependent methyltransferase
MNSALKQSLKRLSTLGIEVNYAFDSGLSVAGYNLGRARRRFAERSAAALSHCLDLKPGSVLDVGSGGGQHAAAFVAAGAAVTCVDYGTSIYATDPARECGLHVINVDFNRWEPDRQYDLVWASHVLEHQRNVGHFLERLIACCAPNGHVAITVPFPHRRLWGGHVSIWTPGLLVYNTVLCGVNLSTAKLIYGYRETSLIFRPDPIDLPELTFDSGDVDKLAHFLPCGFAENTDAWF